ncbi:SDR family NAD(P)-dependent oxidoreductase [Muricauda oceani]|uniref:SDR family NAD(P)-dependent oxidoreductase n=1 Tax=Flagellimonas oceani TaxID=2698672 RepID=A0A6G7IYD5_9FLAO|nr:SDR family NAD(P)-dependent oxidoreductase [Allomuricauda oceani]MBW8244905.1 SDR family NAD(P)-dependent oxidoreductase [Allomuricauda oceani]QII43566.1 SDR family NAD(P)-dependent oxidoreductase [Allomuricauda oceani]
MESKKTVMITGANQGIGFATAKKLLQLGHYHVYIGSRNQENGENAKKDLEKLGFSDFDIVQIDVTDKNTITSTVEKLEGTITHLDILINNAGISGALRINKSAAEGEPFMEQDITTIPLKEVRKVFDVNFFGAIEVTQSFLPLLQKAPSPKIINISSGLGSLTNHTDPEAPYYEHMKGIKLGAYNTSKTALNAFTVMLAAQLQDTSFQINSVSPGFAATNLNNYSGTQNPSEAVDSIIEFVTMGDKGPTGKFFEKEEIAW